MRVAATTGESVQKKGIAVPFLSKFGALCDVRGWLAVAAPWRGNPAFRFFFVGLSKTAL